MPWEPLRGFRTRKHAQEFIKNNRLAKHTFTKHAKYRIRVVPGDLLYNYYVDILETRMGIFGA